MFINLSGFMDQVTTAAEPTPVLLMHMDDTGLTDETGKTVTLNGNSVRSATQSKFGGYSAFFDGTGDYLTIPNSAELSGFGTGDFTIDCWIYPTSLATNTVFLSSFDAWTSDFAYAFRTQTTGTVAFIAGNGGVVTITSAASTISVNNWYHIAATRNGNDFKLFVNGVLVASATNTVSIAASSLDLHIGDEKDHSEPYTGYIDEVRIVKGTAVWTANFTPPTSPYT